MRTREAWLSAVAAALGVSVAACKGSSDQSVAAREVAAPSTSVAAAPSVQPSASPSASETPSASVAASASAAPSVVSGLKTVASGGGQIQLGRGLDGIRGSCGARANCGGGQGVPDVARNAVLTINIGGTPAPEEAVHTRLNALWRGCANAEMAKNPSFRGSLTMEITLVDGGVTNAVITSNNSVPTSVTECMLLRVRNNQFSAGTVPRTLNISVSIAPEK